MCPLHNTCTSNLKLPTEVNIFFKPVQLWERVTRDHFRGRTMSETLVYNVDSWVKKTYQRFFLSGNQVYTVKADSFPLNVYL